MGSFDGAEAKEPPEKKLKRSDAFLIEGDEEVAARQAAEMNETLAFYAGVKHFNVHTEEVQEKVEETPAVEPQTKDGENMKQTEDEGNKENRQRELHRANSRAWHAKWVSKGVPRDAREHEEVPASQPEPAAAENPKCRDMRTACQEFVSSWIATSNMPPSNERRAAAYKAWRESPERAALLAARAAVQV